MGTLLKTPNAQWVLSASFRFNMGTTGSPGGFPGTPDKMANINGVLTAFSVATASTPTFDVMTLPYNSEIISGDVTVVAASNDSGTATIQVGDAGSANRYLGATSYKSTGVTALVPTGFQTAGEKLRITLTNQNGDATAGDVIVRVNFTIKDRANENLKTT
jgi:hypothetical protein